MSVPGNAPPPDDRAAVEQSAYARVERAVRRARLNLLWEAIWPLAAPFLTIAALFAAVSWLGLWRLTSAPVRYAVLAAFAAAVIYFVWRTTRFTLPSRAAAFSRVEQSTGALHRPATSFADQLALGSGDPTTQALWLAHRRRLLAAIERLRAGAPAPRLAAHDPYALRFLVALLFVVGFIVAGPERLERLGEAWQGGETTAAAVARIDAWVTPPTYTGRPPIFLTGETAKPADGVYSVPTGSVVTVRTGGTHDLNVVSIGRAGETTVVPVEAKQTPVASTMAGSAPPLEHQVTLSEPGNVVVRKGGREVADWKFAVESDNPPKIAFLKVPTNTASGALQLSYSLEDDYGVVSASAEMVPVDQPEANTAARPLYDAPALPLSLPQLRTRKGNGETTRDLTSHPWAGAKVRMTLVARDEAGQEGRSEPVEVTLPARQFTNPLARAVVEQRTKLALDANAVPAVADGLDALTMAPEEIDNSSTYLALRSAYYRLNDARNDDDLKGVVDYLWTIALGIEDGDASLAAQQLRAAQEALSKALENNASDEEIAKLTQQLRDAMQKFLQALAEQAQRNPNMASLPPNANIQTLRSQDLERMLDQIENLAKTGARDAARQMLSQLQNMLENLQAGMPQMGNQQNGGQMMQSLNQLGDMIRQQEQLMNQTYRAQRGQDPNGNGDQPMTEEQMQQALKDLQQSQQGLQQQLQQLLDKLQGMGMPSNGKLGQAGESMGQAAGKLGQGQPGQAVGNQGDALDALRQGAQGMAQQLANGGQPGNNGPRGGGLNNFANQDPLGRPQRSVGTDLGTTVKVPDEIDTQRAREILDAIRQRLGDYGLPAIERDYLERLLQQF